jgi:hypothetical protein
MATRKERSCATNDRESVGDRSRLRLKPLGERYRLISTVSGTIQHLRGCRYAGCADPGATVRRRPLLIGVAVYDFILDPHVTTAAALDALFIEQVVFALIRD